jgi:hypothetical protein
VYDGFEQTIVSLPKTPGAVVCVFVMAINQQNALIMETTRPGHAQCKAQARAAGTGDDMVVVLFQE